MMAGTIRQEMEIKQGWSYFSSLVDDGLGVCGGRGVSGGEGGPMAASFLLHDSESEVSGVGKAAWGCDWSGSDMAVPLQGVP